MEHTDNHCSFAKLKSQICKRFVDQRATYTVFTVLTGLTHLKFLYCKLAGANNPDLLQVGGKIVSTLELLISSENKQRTQKTYTSLVSDLMEMFYVRIESQDAWLQLNQRITTR